MKYLKKLAFCSALLMGVSAVSDAPVTVFAEEDLVLSGTCGENLTWEFDEATGTLTISGTGDMDEYVYWVGGGTAAPWYPWETSLYHVKTVIVEEGVTSISVGAFGDCQELTSVSLPESVVYIGMRAFADCISLTEITFPNSVTDIDNGVFDWGPEDLTIKGYTGSSAEACAKEYNYTFEFLGTAPDTSAASGTCGENLTWEFDASTGTLTISGTGEMTEWDDVESTPWHNLRESVQTVVLQEGVTSIGHSAFEDCDSLTGITMPESLKKISSWAISGMQLAAVTVPASVETIESTAILIAEGGSVTVLNPQCGIAGSSDDAVASCGIQPWDNTAKPENIVLRGYDGSTAQQIAKLKGYTFESLGEVPQQTEATLPGDVNCSGLVDVSDAVILARYLAADSNIIIPREGMANADADNSGETDSDDIIHILRIIAQLV